jgi:hypothetical protein
VININDVRVSLRSTHQIKSAILYVRARLMPGPVAGGRSRVVDDDAFAGRARPVVRQTPVAAPRPMVPPHPADPSPPPQGGEPIRKKRFIT